MVVGFTAFVLIVYNGIIDKPGTRRRRDRRHARRSATGVALLASAGIAAAGIGRAMEARRAPSARLRAPSEPRPCRACRRSSGSDLARRALGHQARPQPRARARPRDRGRRARRRPLGRPRREGGGRRRRRRRDAPADQHGADGRDRRHRRGREGRGADALQRRGDRRRQPAPGRHRRRPARGHPPLRPGPPRRAGRRSRSPSAARCSIPAPASTWRSSSAAPRSPTASASRSPIGDVVQRVAERRGVSPTEVTTVILDRERHAEGVAPDPRGRQPHPLHHRRRRLRARCSRSPRAPASTCSGESAARPRASSPPPRSSASAARSSAASGPATTRSARPPIDAGYDIERVLTVDDLVGGNDAFFAATGVTDGDLLQGVRYHGSGQATTESLVMRSRSGTVRKVHAPPRPREAARGYRRPLRVARVRVYLSRRRHRLRRRAAGR